MDNLITILNEYHIQALRKMAQHLNLDCADNARKAEIVKALNEAIHRNVANPGYIMALSQVERAVLGQLLKWNSRASRTQMELRLVLTGQTRSPADMRNSSLPSSDAVLLSLLSKGLLVDQTPQPENKRRQALDQHDVIAIAGDIQGYLHDYALTLPHGLPPKAQAVDSPAYIRTNSMESLFRLLLFIWSDLRQQPAKQLKSGAMSKRDLKRIAEQLGLEGDQGLEHVAYLQELLHMMFLVSDEDGLIKAVDSPAAVLFWNGSMSAKVLGLISAYITLSYDLSVSLREVRQYSYYNLELRHPMEIRQAMLSLLNELSVANSWIPYEVLDYYALPSQHGSFALSAESNRALTYHIAWSANRYETRLDQLLLDLDRILFIKALNELADLGILELGYSNTPDRTIAPTVVRLSPPILAHYQHTSEPNDLHHGQVIVQPDFQVLCMGPVSLGVLASVESCAIREKLDDSVISYRITQDSVYTALQHGQDAASIIAQLEDASGQPVPQNIQRSLREWEGRHDRIVLHHNITILQADSVDFINALLNDAIAGPLITPIDEQTVWVHNDQVNALEQRLTTLHHLVSFTEDAESDIQNSMQWQDEALQTRHPLPSLYVTAMLRRFAENHCDSNMWHITQTSLNLAAQQGLSAPDILETISTMTGMDVPPVWQQRIRAWMGYFGEAQSAPVRLLRLKQNNKIHELRQADPRFTEWLRPMPTVREVAVVEETNWNALCALLAEWGIPVDEHGWW